MTDLLIMIATVVGTFLMVVASLGVLRLPDFFQRVHPPAKSSTLGLLFLLIALVIELPDVETITKAVLAFVFLALTAPAAIHLLTRSAYRQGIPCAQDPTPDDYREFVDRQDKTIDPARLPSDAKIN
ncbi:monovalent cation/H(+) antiporter subunit G [Tautonia rosea]|uniref:monovalent cation/H(+) antiporter subunit G n=1 Tax=Tautonia rosea TaxID=2728037 RepID=UPI0014738BF9|nr:monovalent cation/H(+) antiporter subunit G [Tautonia rosea]